jgi:hypothetical protein
MDYKARSAMQNWGATQDEMRARRDCDELIAPSDQDLYRAVTVDAPPTHVFRWLCQLRAAPYSYDWIDNWGRRSPRELSPGLEELAVGQRFMRIFELVAFEPDRQLTLNMTDPKARRLFGDVAVTYATEPAPANRTRLVAKLVVRYPRTLRGHVMRRFLPWGDLIMMRKQLLTLAELSKSG